MKRLLAPENWPAPSVSLGALVGALLAAAACGGAPPPRAVPARPVDAGPGYAEEIASDRARKDDFFRTESGSPLPDEMKAAFPGLEYFPPDPAWRLVGTAGLYAEPEPFTIIGTEGERRPTERWGRFVFEIEGRTHELQVYRLLAEPGTPLFLPFADETTGRETYPAGRYVDPVVGDDGRVIVDFNTAYYPFCAYGKPYDCPITPAENRLDVAIPAGERGSWTGRRASAPSLAAGSAESRLDR